MVPLFKHAPIAAFLRLNPKHDGCVRLYCTVTCLLLPGRAHTQWISVRTR